MRHRRRSRRRLQKKARLRWSVRELRILTQTARDLGITVGSTVWLMMNLLKVPTNPLAKLGSFGNRLFPLE